MSGQGKVHPDLISLSFCEQLTQLVQKLIKQNIDSFVKRDDNRFTFEFDSKNANWAHREIHSAIKLLMDANITNSLNRPNYCSIDVINHLDYKNENISEDLNETKADFDNYVAIIPLLCEENIFNLKIPVGSIFIAPTLPVISDFSSAKSDSSQIILYFRCVKVDEEKSELPEGMSRNALKKEAKRALKAAKKEQRKKEIELETINQRTKKIESEKGAKSVPIPKHMQLNKNNSTTDCISTPDVEREHVHRVYDTVATQWHGTRYQSWPKVEEFVASLPKGFIVGDLGCGNGKNFEMCHANGGTVIGCDMSGALCKIAATNGDEVCIADIISLPFRSNSFDAILCIAVLHHLSTEARRERAISECMRTAKVGGMGLFYAWAFEQEGNKSGHKFADQDVLVPFHIKMEQNKNKNEKTETKTEKEANNTSNVSVKVADGGDEAAEHGIVDQQKQAVVFQRYCHVYKKGDLEQLVKNIGGWLVVEDCYWDYGNWAIQIRKIDECPYN